MPLLRRYLDLGEMAEKSPSEKTSTEARLLISPSGTIIEAEADTFGRIGYLDLIPRTALRVLQVSDRLTAS